jgi:hypothetical protein
MVDRSTRWLEAVHLCTMEAKVCVEAFINTWVAHYGVSEAVTTDRGRQFTSALWEELCQNLQINHISTTAPSTEQWSGGEDSPPDQGCLEGKVSRQQMA